jgi:signal transduction histidine kinase
VKIGNRLTIQFTVIVGLILLSVLVSVYSLASFNARYFFYERLKERVFIVANIFFEKDELSKERIHVFEEKFQRTLPLEEIDIYDDSRKVLFHTNNHPTPLSNKIFNSIRINEEIEFSEGERQYIGLHYKDNEGNFFIVASAIDETGGKKLNFLLLVCISVYVVSLMLIYFFGKYFSRKALNPIIDVVKQVKHIKLSNINIRVSGGKNNDEIQELANTFNDMLERLQHSFETERVFINNASHELRTPLTSIIGELQVSLSKERNQKELTTTIETTLNQSIQMKDLVNSLLLLTQIEDYTSTQTNFNDEIRIDELLLDLKQNINKRYPDKIVKYHSGALPEESNNLIIKGNKLLLYSAISNIIENGIKFSNEKQVICVLNCYQQKIKIDVIDQGIGIDERDVESIFHPFFRANNARGFKGHGIGLSISNGIIKKHGGKITVISSPNKGTTFSIEFN